MTTHTPGTWFLAPSTDRSDEYAAGYDGNTFASREEAEAAIPALQACDEAFAAAEWVAVRRPLPTYAIHWTNGRVDGGYETLDAAEEAVRAAYPDAAIGHDGDLRDICGDRTLCWRDEEESIDDDGARAVCSIYREEVRS